MGDSHLLEIRTWAGAVLKKRKSLVERLATNAAGVGGRALAVGVADEGSTTSVATSGTRST